MKKLIWLLTFVVILVLGVVSFAGQPQQNVNPRRHPNLAAAQRLSEEAFQKTIAAQQANEFDMAGHAQKAKDFLEKANNQLKMAAEAANHN